MKKLITLIPCLLASVSSFAQPANVDDMEKQLAIMNNIIKTSLKASVSSDKQALSVSSIENLYLKDQGAVFTIHSNSQRHHWREFEFITSDHAMPMTPKAPLPPLPPGDGNYEIVMDIDETIDHAMEMAGEQYEIIVENFHHEREAAREIRDEQRDVAYELRDVEREIRDIEFQQRRASNDEKEALKKQLADLNKSKDAIKVKHDALIQKNEAIVKQQKIEQEKRQAARKQYFTNVSVGLAETVCLYGNGLKALGKDEKVTFIVKSAGDMVNGRYKDMIYVLNKGDISACASEKISAAKLLDKSHHYQW